MPTSPINIHSGNLKDLKALGVDPKTIAILEGARDLGATFRNRNDMIKIGLPRDEIDLVLRNVSLAPPAQTQSIKTAVIETNLPDRPGYKLQVRYQNKKTHESIVDVYAIEKSNKTQIKYDDHIASEQFRISIKSPGGNLVDLKYENKRDRMIQITRDDLKKGIKIEVTIPALIKSKISTIPPSYLKGRILSNNPASKLEKIQLVIEVAKEEEGGKLIFYPVCYAVTEEDGYFSTSPIQYSDPDEAAEFIKARVKIALPNVSDKEIKLVEVDAATKRGQLPPKLILFIEQASTNLESSASSDCDCKDLDFHERKVLDEFSFYTVVRTTEPLIKAFKIEDVEEIDLADIPGDPEVAGKLRGMMVPSDIINDLLRKFGVISERNIEAVKAAAQRALQEKKLQDFINHANGHKPPKAPTGRIDLDGNHDVDWDLKPTIYQATTIAHGHLLHFKQEWFNDGYTIGDLLYSLPLAPGQKKQIVVFDWDRKESASNTQRLDYQDKLYNSLSRDRDVTECVRATLREEMDGNSDSTVAGWGVGGGGGAAIPIPVGPIPIPVGLLVGAGGGGGAAGSTAHQESERTTSARSHQHITDRTVQAANSVRSQRSTVIQTVSQGERFEVSAEVVANYNHCHAMTIEYFEVLRHFEITTRLADVQECLFIPLMLTPFTRKKALRWRDILFRCLKKRSLVSGFDALERLDEEFESATENYYDQIGIPQTRYAEQELEYIEGELYFEFQIKMPELPSSNLTPEQFAADMQAALLSTGWRSFGDVLGVTPANFYENFIANQQNKDEAFAQNAGRECAEAIFDEIRFFAVKNGQPISSRRLPVDATLLSDFKNKKRLNVSLRMSGPMTNGLRREDIDYVKISLDGATSRSETLRNLMDGGFLKVIVHSGSLRYRTRDLHEYLFRDSNIKNDLTLDGDDVRIFTPLSARAMRNPRREDVDVSNSLLHHLNENLEYYHQCLWLKMDAARRYMLLDGLIAPGKAQGKSVASVVENKLIGIVGNCLVMPVAAGFQLDPTLDGDINLFNYYYDVPKDPTHVALPTKGVFAEAVMGKCNSCEVKEESRFWRWGEAPVPDSPTTINPFTLPTPQAIQPSNLQPKDFPAPVIALQTGPELPQPQGFSSLVNLLANPNLFRDITGLSENQKNALNALQSAFSTAQFFGSKAADLTNTAARLQLLDQIKMAKENGLLKEDQAQELTKKALTSLVETTDGSSDNSPVNRIKAVDDLVRTGVVTDAVNKAKAEELKGKLISQLGADFTSSPIESIVKRTIGSDKGKVIFASNQGETINAEFDDSRTPVRSENRVPQNVKDNALEVNREIRRLNDALQTTRLYEGELLLSNFVVASEQLNEEHKVMLDELISISNKKDFKIKAIEGHASQTGPELRIPNGTFIGNKDLSTLRAETVAQYLLNANLDPNKIESVTSFGSFEPIVSAKGEELGINRSVLLKYQFSITQTVIIPELTELVELACSGPDKTRDWTITPMSVSTAFDEFKTPMQFKDFVEDLRKMSEGNVKKEDLIEGEVVTPVMFFRIRNDNTGESRIFVFSSIGLSVGVGAMFSTATSIQESEPQGFITAQCASFDDFNTFGWYVDIPSFSFNGITGSPNGRLLLSNVNLGVAIDMGGLSFSIGIGMKVEAKSSLGVLHEIPGTSSFDV